MIDLPGSLGFLVLVFSGLEKKRNDYLESEGSRRTCRPRSAGALISVS